MTEFSTQGDLAFREVLETALNEGVAACFRRCYVPPETTRRVAVIGAGIAGLVAAKELLQAGQFDVQIYERTERVGGRAYTLRGFSDELYAEGGAMRIPQTHYLTHGVAKALSSTGSKISSSREEKEEKSGEPSVRLLPFFQKTGAYVIEGKPFINDESLAKKLEAEFGIKPVLVNRVVNEYYFDLAKKKAEAATTPLEAWQQIFKDMDGFSVRTYFTHKLKEDKEYNFSEDDVLKFLWLYNVVGTTESLLETDVIELFKEYVGDWWKPDELTQIKGGTDVLASEYAKAYALTKHVKFGIHVVGITKTENGKYSIVYHNQAEKERTDAGFDDVIITVPFTCLRLIDVDSSIKMDTTTKQAIRTLQYLASTKVLLQFRERFWTNLKVNNIQFGSLEWGAIKTDLPIRNIYAPNPDMYNGTKRGVLLASYTWGLDGIELASMKDVDLIQQALKNVKEVFGSLGYDPKLHGDIDELFEQGRVQRWGQTEWTAGGAFCFVAPGQYTTFYDKIVSPQDNGKVILAGEHASNSHGWIQGAIESGLRAAIQIYQEEYQIPPPERKTFTFGTQQYKKLSFKKLVKLYASAPTPSSETVVQ